MAAFDMNSLYFIRGAAPKSTTFEEAFAPVQQGFSLGRAYNENYNKNSLQNLIAQREREGVPYDRLSNEAAKWDLGAANAMRGERRASLEYNYKQSVAEFEMWRKQMARRICGLILQKADELGLPFEEYDRVLNVAASYVMTYDEDLAQWLIGQGQVRRYNQGRLNNRKPSADHEKEISRLTVINVNKDENPSNFAELTGQQHAAQAVLRYKNATGRDIWLRQVQYLLNEAKQRFPGYINAGGTFDSMRAWLDNLSVEELESIIGGIQDDSTSVGLQSTAPEQAVPATGVATGKPSGGSVSGATEKRAKAPSIITVDPGSKKQKVNYDAVGRMQEFIDENEFDVEALKDARRELVKGMTWSEGQSGGSESSALNSMIKKIDELLKRNSEIGEDSPSAFKKAFNKMLSTGRTATSLNAMMTAFHNVVSSADKSQSPLTFLNSILLAQLPFYKATDYDAKAALKLKGADSWDNLKSVLATMDVPFFSSLASYANIDAAIDAALQDFTRTFNGMYDNWLQDAKDEKEKEKIIKGVKSRWNLGPRDIAILKDGNLPIGDIRKKLQKKADEEYGKTYTDEKGRKVESSTGRIIEEAPSTTNYTETDWANF